MTEPWMTEAAAQKECLERQEGKKQNKTQQPRNFSAMDNKGNVNTLCSKTSIHFAKIFFMPAFWLP